MPGLSVLGFLMGRSMYSDRHSHIREFPHSESSEPEIMRVACCTVFFTQHPGEEALWQIAQLGFLYVDLGERRWAQTSTLELVQSGDRFAESFKRGLELANVELGGMRGATARAWLAARRCLWECNCLRSFHGVAR